MRNKISEVLSTAKCGMHKSIKLNYFEHINNLVKKGYDSKGYGVLNHNLKLQCEKLSRTRDIPNFPTHG